MIEYCAVQRLRRGYLLTNELVVGAVHDDVPPNDDHSFEIPARLVCTSVGPKTKITRQVAPKVKAPPEQRVSLPPTTTEPCAVRG
jgi:hypothetical protein